MKKRAIPHKHPTSPPPRLKTGLEALFLFLCCLYWVYRISRMTMLSLPWPEWYETALLVATGAVAVVRLCLSKARRWETWAGVGIAVVYGLVYRADGYTFLLFLAAQTAGMIDIDHRKALRVHLAPVGAVLLAAVFAALCGSTTNIVHFSDGLHSSWGISYHTDFSTAFLFLMLMLWVLWRSAPDLALTPLALASGLLALVVTHSRNALVCSALFLCVILYRWLEARVIKRRKGLRWIPRAVDGVLTVAFPLCACVMFLMVFLYARDTALGHRLNDMLTDRLRLSLESFRTHGLTPFGTPIAQRGNGASQFPPSEYSFLDSSYMLILLRYGWVTLLMLSATWGLTVRRAIRGGHQRLALALGVIAFHALAEHHFMNPQINPLLVLPLAAYAPLRKDRPVEKASTRKAWAAVAVGAVGVAAGWLLLPRLFTRLKTVFGILGWQGGGLNALPVILVALVTTSLIGGIAWALYSLLCAAIRRERPGPQALAALLACVALGAGGWAWAGSVVAGAMDANAALLEADAAGLDVVLGAASGKVYVDALPEVYMRRFGGISATALPGDDLARHRGATALMDAGQDHRIFFLCGFKYAQISPAHSVYTDDDSVAQALEAAGYAVTDYYATPVEVDLAEQAARNRLTLDENGLLVNGKTHSLRRGPYQDLFAGFYEVTYRLALTDKTLKKRDRSDDDLLVCTLRVESYRGKYVLAELPVYASQFDEAGELVVNLPFATDIARNVEFLLFAETFRQVCVQELSFRQISP